MKTVEEKGMELYPLIPNYDNIASSDEFSTNEIKYIERLAFRKGAEFAKEIIAREVIESIFDYEKESGCAIINFDRTPEDILKIYLETE